MAELSFYRLGTDPDAEARRMRALYDNHGVDHAVYDEFEATVHAYRHSSFEEISERIRSRCVDAPINVLGVIATVDEVDVGMSITGPKDFRRAASEEAEPGINVSAWILRQHRHMGYGKRSIAQATFLTKYLRLDPTMPTWHDRTIWTSVKTENIASRRACEYAGFVEAGPHIDQPGRILYIAE